MLGLVQGTNALVRFTTTTAATVGTPLPVTGLAAGDTLRAIDYRPANGLLYGLGVDASNAVVRTYTINPLTGAATVVGGPVSGPTPSVAWDINFNPTVDRIRVVNEQDENARLHPDFGSLAGDDTDLSPPAATVGAVAYSNRSPGRPRRRCTRSTRRPAAWPRWAASTARPAPTAGSSSTSGPLGVSITAGPAAFDIATNNTAYAVLRPSGGASTLYAINLATGAATPAGTVGDGSPPSTTSRSSIRG